MALSVQKSTLEFETRHRDQTTSPSIRLLLSVAAARRAVKGEVMEPLEMPHIKQNLLLSAVPPADLNGFEAQGERITARAGDTLFEGQHESLYVYFCVDSVVSLFQDFEVGGPVEIAIVGNEGVVGLHNLFGIRLAAHQAVVQAPGRMIRFKASVALAEFARGGRFQELMLKYSHSLLVQIAQTAACNRLHSIDRKLARWLLAFHDRIECDELTLTQEFLSLMLGSRRAGVNLAVGQLTRLALIEHSRNRIRIIDRDGLEGFACECYAAVNDQYERSLGFGFSKRSAESHAPRAVVSR